MGRRAGVEGGRPAAAASPAHLTAIPFRSRGLRPPADFRDPSRLEAYLSLSYLARVSAEPGRANVSVSADAAARDALSSLERLMLVRFTRDTVLVPADSAWFAELAPSPGVGDDPVLVPHELTALWREDWLGLRALDELGRVTWLSVDADHLKGIDVAWLEEHVVPVLRGD